MANSIYHTLKIKSRQELVKILEEKRRELQGINFGAAGSKAIDVKRARKLRRDIARILTAFNHLRNE